MTRPHTIEEVVFTAVAFTAVTFTVAFGLEWR
jgi:hypothetical protein